jgi:hypothetical protein
MGTVQSRTSDKYLLSGLGTATLAPISDLAATVLPLVFPDARASKSIGELVATGSATSRRASTA